MNRNNLKLEKSLLKQRKCAFAPSAIKKLEKTKSSISMKEWLQAYVYCSYGCFEKWEPE